MTNRVVAAILPLPVRDPDSAADFYDSLGWLRTLEFNGPTSRAISPSPTLIVLLYAADSPIELSDGAPHEPPPVSLIVSSPLAVDALVDKALGLHATEIGRPEDTGERYSRAFRAPDGIVWDVVWLSDGAA